MRGDVRCAIITDFPERFRDTERVLLGDAKTPYIVEQTRLVKGAVLIKLRDVSTRTDAEKLRGQTLYVPDDEAVVLDEGTYFWHQIIGLDVRTIDGEALGRIVEILPTGSNDVYVVRSGAGELLIPAIKDVVRNVDLDQRVMTVELIDGLR
jgi:16S rRNA processing protein RimM